MRKVELVIIGGGPAGMAAAAAAYDAGMRDILLLERENTLGGMLRQSIHSGFGLAVFGEELTGPECVSRFANLLAVREINCLCNATVVEICKERKVIAVHPVEGVIEIMADAIILAMGARERPFGTLGIPGGRAPGVYLVGTAQKLINLYGLIPGNRAVILGGDDRGMIMARRLLLEGCRVMAVVESKPFLRGQKRLLIQCLEDFGVPLLLRHTVAALHGREHLEGVTIAEADGKNRPIPGTERRIDCDMLLYSGGLLPDDELLRSLGAALSPSTGGPVADERLQTSMAGIFACGNALHTVDLLEDSAEEGQRAGKNAVFFIRGKLPQAEEYHTLHEGEGVTELLPQHITCGTDTAVRLLFRSGAAQAEGELIAEEAGRELCRMPCKAISPGGLFCCTMPAAAFPCDKSDILLRIEVLGP